MTLKYLLDENVDPAYAHQLRRTDLVVRTVGEPATPTKATLDAEILGWCEANGFMLVTDNRASMPVHLADHRLGGAARVSSPNSRRPLAQDRHVPGIFILNPNLSIGENLEKLIIAASASFDEEYQDRIEYLLLTQ